jgi:hypothetical protein
MFRKDRRLKVIHKNSIIYLCAFLSHHCDSLLNLSGYLRQRLYPSVRLLRAHALIRLDEHDPDALHI